MCAQKAVTAKIADLLTLKHAAEMLNTGLKHNFTATELVTAMDLVQDAAETVKRGLTPSDDSTGDDRCAVDGKAFESLPKSIADLKQKSTPPRRKTEPDPMDNYKAELNSATMYSMVKARLKTATSSQCRLT